jgi:magnesium-transporting ATPase (P-type)
MLTGDKLETAICTSIACGIKAPNQEVTMIRDVTDELHIQDLLLHINP